MEYRPGVATAFDDPQLREFSRFVEQELAKIAAAFLEQERVYLRVLNAAPSKPREGQLAWADGTNWNPGSGAGPYAYISGTWTKLKP